MRIAFPFQPMSLRFTQLRATLFLFLAATFCTLQAAVPQEMEQALAHFRTEGPSGWAYTQTTQSGGERLIESFDPLRPEGSKWKLLETNGRVPTPDEAAEYQRGKIQRSSALNAPRLEQQLDLGSCEPIEESPALLGCRFRLLAGEGAEEASLHLRVSVFVDRGTHTVSRIEIRSAEPFSPVFGVRIRESLTVLEYAPSRPGEAPLLTRARLTVRGRAFWLHSLDQDMEIRWGDHAWRGAARRSGQ
jgi:hypothetical protein